MLFTCCEKLKTVVITIAVIECIKSTFSAKGIKLSGGMKP